MITDKDYLFEVSLSKMSYKSKEETKAAIKDGSEGRPTGWMYVLSHTFHWQRGHSPVHQGVGGYSTLDSTEESLPSLAQTEELVCRHSFLQADGVQQDGRA